MARRPRVFVEGLIYHVYNRVGRGEAPERRRVGAAEFLTRAAPLVGVSTDELASPQRGPEALEARELIGGLAIERWGIGVKALADALGKSRDGVSHWVLRAARRRHEARRFVAKLDELDRRLAREIGRASR